jgi:hypothetical protein
MKILRKAYGTASVMWLIAGCFISLSIGVVGSTHMAPHLRRPDAASHMRREMLRCTKFDLTESGQDVQMEAASLYEPATVFAYVTLAAGALIAPTATVGSFAPPEMSFMTRRKLLSPRTSDPDPLI